MALLLNSVGRAGGAAAPLSPLAQAAAALSPGDTVSYAPAANHGLSEAQLEWQSMFFHDTLNNELMLFGKEANAEDPGDWHMRRFSIAAETWSTHNNPTLARSGHIYGAFCLDTTTGDAYATPGQGTEVDLWKYTRSGDSWAQHRSDFYVTTSRPANGLALHPNLYGSGVRGVVALDRTEILAFYRPGTDTIERIDTNTSVGTTSGLGVYWPARDEVICGVTTHLRVSPNGGSTPSWEVAGTPPIATRGTSSAVVPDFGSMFVHPGNPNKLMILRRGGDFAYWTSTDATTWSEDGVHPFPGVLGNAQVVCSLGDSMGCVLGIFANGSTHTALLWRPPV